MALHEVMQIENVMYVSEYVKAMANEFIDMEMDIAEIDVPTNSKSVLAFQQNAIQVLKRCGLNTMIRVAKRGDKVYFIKK